jgi:serum/glucocorticoid-regulated kinase 2
MLYVIGKGGFGKVWKVKYKKNSKFYALKEMSKVKVLDKKSDRSIMYEKLLLSNLRHPFIINMHYAFQDHENLYLVMDLLNGGDLRYHISRYKLFNEEQTSRFIFLNTIGFFIACIVLGLEYIHDNGIIHRDIKPENLVLDERGYVRLTDFGVAKLHERENSSETSGTPGYMSPEVMWGQNHTHAVDYFALGIICYEFMNGKVSDLNI